MVCTPLYKIFSTVKKIKENRVKHFLEMKVAVLAVFSHFNRNTVTICKFIL